MQQSKEELSKQWLKIDPIEQPILKDAPAHDVDRFKEYVELRNEQDEVIGFTVEEKVFLFDHNGGWKDEKGCYYNEDGQPAGWFVLHPGDQYHEHFYDQDAMYVPTDIEDDPESESDDPLQD